ncbi:MAG: transcription elongation factor GreA [Dehalococcoidia bacterium]
MDHRKTHLTPRGLKDLKAELEILRGEKRQKIYSRLKEAVQQDGTSDNAEYEEVKNAQSFLENRIRSLEEILSNVQVSVPRSSKASVVEFGSRITVVGEDGKRKRYQIVGSAEASPTKGRISDQSPVAKALYGHKVGDTIEVKTPARTSQITIKSIT